MNRSIGRMQGHVIVCGWGRVGAASRRYQRATRDSRSSPSTAIPLAGPG